MMRRIYISAPYTAGSAQLVQANIERACAIGAQVRALGACPVIPHVAVIPFEGMSIEDAWGPAMHECLSHLAGCDAIMMCEGWEDSRGCRVEFNQAAAWMIPAVSTMAELRRLLGVAA